MSSQEIANQRKEVADVRSLVDTFVESNSSRAVAVAADISKRMSNMSKRIFVSCVDDILSRAFQADHNGVMPYIKLFEQIKQTTIKLENGQSFPISQAVSGFCMKHPDCSTTEDVTKFRNKLPLINEFYKMNLIQRGFFKFFAKMFANRPGDVATGFLYEILCNVDWLMEMNIFGKIDELDEAFWADCVYALSERYRKNTIVDPELSSRIYNLLENIQKKGRYHSNGLRLERLSPTEPVLNSSMTPLPEDDRQLSEIRLVMQSLARYPEQLSTCSKHIQYLLESYCSSSKSEFAVAIDELLNEAMIAEPRAFRSCILLIEHLVKTLPAVALRKAIVQSAMQIHRLETVDHVFEFCSSFRLSNELCRLGLLQSHVFKHYVNELAKPERDLSYLFAFEAIRNVDHLIDTGVAKLNGQEVEFWEGWVKRLLAACPNRRLVSAGMEKEVIKFINQLKQKGGWNRTTPQVVVFDQTKGLQLPSVIGSRRASRTPESSGTSKSTSPCPSLQPTNMMEDTEFRTLTEIICLAGSHAHEAVARLFKTKLQSVSLHFFTEAIEIILAKLFLQIDSDISVERAAKLCMAFNKQNYGNGKKFMAELEKACLNYLSSKCRADVEKTKKHLQAGIGDEKMVKKQLEQLEMIFKQKNVSCVRLLAKFYELKMSNMQFLMSVADSLLSQKSEEAMECLSELLLRVGKDLQAEAYENGMAEWWGNFFDKLADTALAKTASDRLKVIAAIILQTKMNGWPDFDRKQQSMKCLQAMLLELTPQLVKSPEEISGLQSRIRSFVATDEAANLPSQTADVFLAKIFDLLADNERLLKELQNAKSTSSKQPSAGSGHVVKLPEAAPKPRRQTRWDQPPSRKPQVSTPNQNLQNLQHLLANINPEQLMCPGVPICSNDAENFANPADSFNKVTSVADQQHTKSRMALHSYYQPVPTGNWTQQHGNWPNLSLPGVFQRMPPQPRPLKAQQNVHSNASVIGNHKTPTDHNDKDGLVETFNALSVNVRSSASDSSTVSINSPVEDVLLATDCFLATEDQEYSVTTGAV